LVAVIAIGAVVAGALYATPYRYAEEYRYTLFFAAVAVVLVGGVTFLAWHADPAWTLTVGLMLTPFAGSWDRLGVPSILAPDRGILFTGLLAAVLRGGRGIQGRPRIRIAPLHVVMIALIAYASLSALIVGTLFDRTAFFVLFERLGVIPYLAFACAPVVFRTARQRQVLLIGLVCLGGYLGLTALFEGTGLKSLVWPRYIVDSGYGFLPDRARGPFVEPATNGMALFTCGAACVVSVVSWRSATARLCAGAVLLLCALGIIFTLTRQVWIGAIVAIAAVIVATRVLRRYALVTAAAGALLVGGALATVPGLSERAAARKSQQTTVWDRYNLNTAALNAIAANPLFGVGWQAFSERKVDYLELNPNFPLTAGQPSVPVHNAFLTYGSELGLVGLTLWTAALLAGVGGTLFRRGPPELQPWRLMLLGVAVFYLVIATFEFPQSFSNLTLWMIAGVVAAGGTVATLRQ
jgi:putative inorganic carbon (HCO3(-)) transporter